MNLGFYIILAAQFLSALADNALLFAAIALLQYLDSPNWYTPVLQQGFIISYIVLAPFVGAFADSLPKGRVMFISNTVKLAGCVAMLAGVHPLLAYGTVGLGAAAYSPAKYGILTEYLHPDLLVKANSWMEGMTVAAIVLGAMVGGMLISPPFATPILHALNIPLIDNAAELAIAVIVLIYIAAAVFNLYIPRVAIDHKPLSRNPVFLTGDFWHCFKLLWKDPLGQVSLAVTTLFWGAGATLRLLVLGWAAIALHYDISEAAKLTAWVAVGIAIGAVLAAEFIKLEHSVKVLPVGIGMGIAVLLMILPADRHRRDGRLFRRAHECAAATSRPPADGRGTLHRSAELQREPEHFRDAGTLRHDGMVWTAHLHHHPGVRPAAVRHHGRAVQAPRPRSGYREDVLARRRVTRHADPAYACSPAANVRTAMHRSSHALAFSDGVRSK
jgi:hypothetical protein